MDKYYKPDHMQKEILQTKIIFINFTGKNF